MKENNSLNKQESERRTSNTDRTKMRENNSQNKQKSERRTDGAGVRENDCNVNQDSKTDSKNKRERRRLTEDN